VGIAVAASGCIVCEKQKGEHSDRCDHQYQRDRALPRWNGWHAFRRGLATNLYADGIQDKTIQGILRHANVRVTQDAYIKSIPSTAVAAMQSIGAKLAEHAPSMHRPEAQRPN